MRYSTHNIKKVGMTYRISSATAHLSGEGNFFLL